MNAQVVARVILSFFGENLPIAARFACQLPIARSGNFDIEETKDIVPVEKVDPFRLNVAL